MSAIPNLGADKFRLLPELYQNVLRIIASFNHGLSCEEIRKAYIRGIIRGLFRRMTKEQASEFKLYEPKDIQVTIITNDPIEPSVLLCNADTIFNEVFKIKKANDLTKSARYIQDRFYERLAIEERVSVPSFRTIEGILTKLEEDGWIISMELETGKKKRVYQVTKVMANLIEVLK